MTLTSRTPFDSRLRRLLKYTGVAVLAAVSSFAQAVTSTYTSSGTWVAPTGVTSVTVEAWGGGGAGGSATGNPAKGGGGAGGQYAKKVVTVTPGNSYSITVGAGGAGSSGNGAAGGDSTFNTNTVVAKGGAGGMGAGNGVVGGGVTTWAAGAGSTVGGVGDVVYAGGGGAAGQVDTNCNSSGAGGGGAGSGGAGGAASGNTGGTGAATGGGAGGAASNSSGNGSAGSSAGGGGSGACAESNTDQTGGNGAPGQVVLTYSLPFACSQPANTPAGLTLSCQCDTFNRASLQPSTIFNSNWLVSTSDSTGISPSIVNPGYLRLTNNTGNNAKAATVPGIFPAAGNYISVEFQQYAYNGSGADGIALTLSDYSIPAVPGAYGGSLGYAQETGIHDGFEGGWIGVALDEYGNYQNNNEGRLGGPGFTVESVGVRGSGSGQTGYRWLGGTGSLTPNIDNGSSTTPSPGYYYQVIVDARNEPTSTAVSVNRNTGSGYSSLINIPNVYAAATSQGFTQSPVPTNWQISFTGSTGGSTNIHEIGGLRICASNMVAPGGGTAGAFNAVDEAYGTPPSVAVQNYLAGHIFTKLVGTPFKLNVAALTNSGQILSTYAISSAKTVTVNLVDNSDSLTDSTKDCTVTCTSTCTSKSAVTGGTQTLTFASGAGDKGQKQSANFTINSAYQKLVAIISDGTTSACSTDAFAVRPTALSVSTTATATTSTGTPLFKAGSGSFSLNVASNTYSLAATTVPQALTSFTGYSGTPSLGAINTSPMGAGTWTAGSLSGGTSLAAAVSGVSTNSETYSEVGLFKLVGLWPNTAGYGAGDDTSARGVYDASWTAVDSIATKGDCVAGSYSNLKNAAGKFGCNFGIVTDVTFGRFIPDHFDTTVIQTGTAPAIVPMTCPSGLTCPANTSTANGMVYSGQAFSVQVSAKNASGATTVNYQGSFAKDVTLSAVASSGGTAIATTSPGGTLSAASVAAANFSAGTNAAILATPVFTFATTPTAPTDVFIRAVDADGASSLRSPSSASVEGGVKVASGRIWMPNYLGSERLPLNVTATVQYYSGTNWITSATDNVSTFNTNLSTSGGNLVATVIKGPISGVTVAGPGSAAVVAGVRSFTLAAPLSPGSVNLMLNAPTYLPNAGARATFGVFKSPLIYRRENY